MSRKTHPNKEIEEAVCHAEANGRTFVKGRGHCWGILRCPFNDADCRCGEFCQISIWSTPRVPEHHARQIRRAVDGGGAEMIWEFVLKFRLPESGQEPSAWLDALFKAGCNDATVGVGRIGSVALDFSREAPSAEEALRSAIENVQAAIPGSVPIEAGPDLVNLADLAEVVGCSRQNLRKYAAGEIRTLTVPFPEPVFSGNPSLWRLVEVGAWLDRFTDLHPPKAMIEIGRVTSALNLDIQHRRLREGASGDASGG